MVVIRRLTGTDKEALIPDLAGILLDCVDGGASVGFMAGTPRPDVETFFRRVFASVEMNERILLAAFAGSQLVGTVQLLTAMPPNQPHRGEIAKLLVLRSARGEGVATRLMEEAERCARETGKTLLVLDTVTGGHGERLYSRLGWKKAGIIPNYALFPDGRYADTSVFWKELR